MLRRFGEGEAVASNAGEYNLYSFKKDDRLLFIPFRLSSSYLVKGWRMASLARFIFCRATLLSAEEKILFSHHLCSIEFRRRSPVRRGFFPHCWSALSILNKPSLFRRLTSRQSEFADTFVAISSPSCLFFRNSISFSPKETTRRRDIKENHFTPARHFSLPPQSLLSNEINKTDYRRWPETRTPETVSDARNSKRLKQQTRTVQGSFFLQRLACHGHRQLRVSSV